MGLSSRRRFFFFSDLSLPLLLERLRLDDFFSLLELMGVIVMEAGRSFALADDNGIISIPGRRSRFNDDPIGVILTADDKLPSLFISSCPLLVLSPIDPIEKESPLLSSNIVISSSSSPSGPKKSSTYSFLAVTFSIRSSIRSLPFE